MEFIGDMADSTVGGNINQLTHGALNDTGVALSAMPGRGIN